MSAPIKLISRWLALLFCAYAPASAFAHQPPPCGLMGEGTAEEAPLAARFSFDSPFEISPEVQVKKIHNTGADSSRLNLVFVSEGFTKAELDAGAFSSSVAQVVDFMRQTAPWNKFLSLTNIYAVEIASDRSGASHPMLGIDGAGYLEASYGVGAYERLITLSYRGEMRLNRLLNSAFGKVKWNAAVIVNDPQYGGSGGRYAVSALDQLPQVMTHELGHSIFGLADEYGGSATHFDGEAAPPNIDTTLPPKWHHWIEHATEMPTQPVVSSVDEGRIALNSEIGAYEGGMGYDYGVFHPSASCMMSNLTGFCSVCRQAMVKKFLQMVPLSSKIKRKAKQASVTVAAFPDLSVSWKLCGKKAKSRIKGRDSVVNISKAKSRCMVQAVIEYKGPWVRGDAARQALYR